MDNYRPISILPTVSKLLERELFMCNYMITYESITFSAHISVASGNSILRILRLYLFADIHQGLTAGAVFIDPRKAFDSVNHSLLSKKLRALGIVNQEYEWFADCLKG